ncbi:MAG: ABC transporter permease [Gammaproteobacteria bacterium]
MNGFLTDLRVAFRQLVARPGFTAAAILTLALGIGANTAVFSFLSGYLLRPLPYPNSTQLTRVYVKAPKVTPIPFPLSLPLYRVIQQNTNSFTSTAIYHTGTFDMKIGGHARHVTGLYSSASLFRVLGVPPLLGRTFTADNMRMGSDHVAVISYGLWHSSFGANSNVIGKTVQLDDGIHRIIGVMPEGFAFPDRDTAIWVPYAIMPKALSPSQALNLSLPFIGRLKSGIDLHAAKVQIQHAVSTYMNSDVPANIQKMAHGSGFEMAIKSWRQELLGDRPATLWLLQGAVLLILLITCVNVANLLLSRILGRSHEIAMRSTLGATRAVLAQQLLAEALCLTIPGGLVGVLLAWLALHFLAGSSLGAGSSVFTIALGWRVGLLALGAVLFTAALVSVLPIRLLAKTDLKLVLQEGSRNSSGGRRTKRIRDALVITELTLATGLLAMAGLVLHSFVNLQNVNPGFRTDHVLIAHLQVPENDHAGKGALDSFYADLIQRVDALPGVRKAAIANALPFGDNFDFPYEVFSIPGQKIPVSGTPPSAWVNRIGPGFFKALDIPLLSGRRFERGTADKTAAIVSADLAKKYFHGANPIGRQVKVGDAKYTITGVVPAIKYDKLSQSSNSTTIYLDNPALHVPDLVIHTSLPPNALIKPVKTLIAAADPNIAVYDVHTMREQLSASLRDRQTTMALLVAFGGIALALAIIGVYAVLSYAVSQRRSEFAVRMALGAVPGNLQALVIKDGLKLLLIGLVVGLALAVLFGHVLASLLFHVVPYDPLTLGVTIGVLALTTFFACYLPARRATKLNPAEVIYDQ